VPTLSALDKWVNRKAGIRRNNFNADLNNKVREYQHLKKFKMQNEKLKIRYKRAELFITHCMILKWIFDHITY